MKLNEIPDHVKIVAHGPVTAAGVEALGPRVDEISKGSSSFSGMIQAIADSWSKD